MTTTKQPTSKLAKPTTAKPYVMTVADKARMALKPSMNGAAVI